MTCERAREFLAQEHVVVTEMVDAKKTRLGPEQALALARQASTIHSARGQKVTVFDRTTASPTDAELLKALLGPSGALRAPTIRLGTTLVVGFNEDLYRQVLAE
jgi:arsenate reductase-like glutaredoxin family protein